MRSDDDARVRPKTPRALLVALAVLAAIPCCSSAQRPALEYPSVREAAAKALDCAPAGVHLAEDPSPTGVYLADGCGRSVSLTCTEFADGVTCRDVPPKSGNGGGQAGGEGSDNDTTDTSDDSGGCGCGHLFSGKHNANDPPSNNNPTSTTPQRTKR